MCFHPLFQIIRPSGVIRSVLTPDYVSIVVFFFCRTHCVLTHMFSFLSKAVIDKPAPFLCSVASVLPWHFPAASQMSCHQLSMYPGMPPELLRQLPPELIFESIIIKQTDPGTSSVNLASSCALISGYASHSGIFLSLFRLRVYYNYTHKLSFCYYKCEKLLLYSTQK